MKKISTLVFVGRKIWFSFASGVPLCEGSSVSSYASLVVSLILDWQVSSRSAKKSESTIIRLRRVIAVEVDCTPGAKRRHFQKERTFSSICKKRSSPPDNHLFTFSPKSVALSSLCHFMFHYEGNYSKPCITSCLVKPRLQQIYLRLWSDHLCQIRHQ